MKERIHKKLSTKKITLLALLTALQVVFGKLLQISLLTKEYNLGFLPIAVAAAYMGIPGGVIVAVLGDVIGSLLFPTGTYFPGFTLTAALVGMFYGLFLHQIVVKNDSRSKTLFEKKKRNNHTFVFILFSVIAVLLTNWLLNSLWISMLYTKKGYFACVIARAPTYLIELPLQFIIIFLTLKGLEKLPESLFGFDI